VKKENHAMLVRVPMKIYDYIKKSAVKERRSISGEVILILQKHIDSISGLQSK
jgi:hypothetical protein